MTTTLSTSIFRITERDNVTDELVRVIYDEFDGVVTGENIAQSVVWREQNAKTLVRTDCHARLERRVDGEWEYL